jgi:RNA polymerase sigma-70 factor (ECF subfamily)
VWLTDFDELYAAHYGSLTTQLYAYLGDRQEAQDLVQEAFCRAYARWRSVRDYDDPVAWVRRVAWNLATSHRRRLGVAAAFRRRQRVEHNAPPGPDRVALVAALRELPDRQRRALVLHYLADQPVAEIAQAMGATEGNVRVWLHRGRAALAARLGVDETAVGRGARGRQEP